MKLTKALALAAATLATSGLLVACGDGAAESDDTTAETTVAEATETTAAAELPTAAELNEVLAVAIDSEQPMEVRARTVEGGETVDPALFDTMTAAQEESGANFQVVDPVYPGFIPDSVLATVTFTLPDQEPQVAEDVEFIREDDTWKISQSWACILVHNTVSPEQVPQMCQDESAAPAAPAGEVPAEEGAPGEEGAPAEAPAQ